jgi:protocatechuate 4,5-dioxygenase beta chain
MLVDHALSIPFELVYPDAPAWPIRLVPIAINTVQYPLPSPKRCLALGRAVAKALRSWTGRNGFWWWARAAFRTSSMARAPGS